MPRSQPLLSIGIPTWNRAEELQRCIHMWAAQIAQVHDDVEIFVSDNGSDDRTPEILSDFSCRLKFLRYSRNSVNIGADRNILEVFRQTAGKYVWLFSDDDFITEGALSEILSIIKGYNPSYISTNWRMCDDRKNVTYIPPNRYMMREDLAGADINTIFVRRNHFLSFISSNIYRRDVVDLQDCKQYIDKVENWIQVYVAGQVLASAGNGYLAAFDAVLCHLAERRYSSDVFIRGMPEAFDYTLGKFDARDNARKRVLKEMRIFFLPFRRFMLRKALLEIDPSPLMVAPYYQLGAFVPKKWLLFALKVRRMLNGEGFSLPQSLDLTSKAPERLSDSCVR